MMDEESVHVLSLEDDVGCVAAVEARELLAESGRARQTAGGTTVPCVPECFNNSSENAGKLSFYYPHSYRRPLILICYPLAFSCHANDFGHFRFIHTNFFFERVLWMVLPLLTCSHYNRFLNSPTLLRLLPVSFKLATRTQTSSGWFWSMQRTRVSAATFVQRRGTCIFTAFSLTNTHHWTKRTEKVPTCRHQRKF